MKNNQIFPVIPLILVALTLVNLSCHTAKTAVSCPDISTKKSEYRSHHRVSKSRTLIAGRNNFKNNTAHRSGNVQNKVIKNSSPSLLAADKNFQIDKIEIINSFIASADNTYHPLVSPSPALDQPLDGNKQAVNSKIPDLQDIKCDTIVLKSGAIFVGKVEEIGQSEIKYKKCNNLGGPTITLLKSDVARIGYSNGTDEHFDPTDTFLPNQAKYPVPASEPAKTEGLAIAGFVSGLVGLFVASIPLGALAVVFGAISLSKIKKNPQRFKGRGLAIASIILGIVDVVLMLILLAA